MRQKTICNPTSFYGVGLHDGNKSTVYLSPLPVNSGIRFSKMENGIEHDLELSPNNIKDTQLCTALVSNNVKIKTIEHFLAALSMVGIDNIAVRMDGDEMPIMDGSALPFIIILHEAGIKEQKAFKKVIKITSPISAKLGDKTILIEPSNCFEIDFTIDFESEVISSRSQHIETNLKDSSEMSDIAKSRTFGFLNEIEYLQSIGLAKGGSLDNAIVIDEYKILNPGGLRTENEFINHKILDTIGDLYVMGMPIIGKLTAYKTGHALNNMLAREIAIRQDCYKIIELSDTERSKVRERDDQVSQPSGLVTAWL